MNLIPNRYYIIGMWCLLGVCSGYTPCWGYDWPQFKNEFMSRDGRIIDYYQNQTSHSEGQGYAMILAIMHEDQAGFDLLWKWARDNLQVRENDRLLAWSWGQKEPGLWTVIDVNNATDGDLCVAFALSLAADRWRRDDYRRDAVMILDSIKKQLVKERNGLLCLLPGAYGFEKEDGLVFNPSYFVFSAFREFAAHDDRAFWERLRRDSQTLLTRSLDPDTGLPPDWALYDGSKVTPQGPQGNGFGFEAVRVLLFLAWDHKAGLISGLEAHLTRCRDAGRVPAAVGPGKEGPAREDAPGGFYAVYARVAQELGREADRRFFREQADRILAGEDHNYYSKVLYLLSRVEFSQ